MKLRDSVSIVTGASSGIGAAVAVELARRGSTVVGMARRADRLEATMQQCRAWAPGSFAYVGDVSQRETCDAAVKEVTARLGQVDVVVNNAGISPEEDPVARAADDAERLMGINFFGAVYLAGAALPSMVERGRGSILNVTSVSASVPNPGEPAYGASKAALSRWSHGLAVDLHGTGVHVGVLSPGPIETEIWAQTGTEYGGRLYAPEVVARAAALMIERDVVHMTVPRRFGSVGVFYPLVGRPMRWGLRKYAAATHRRDHTAP